MDTELQMVKPTAPALKNVGVMGKAQLEDIISQFKGYPVVVERGDLTLRVVKDDGTKLISAAKIDHNLWHVRAIEGLLRKA